MAEEVVIKTVLDLSGSEQRTQRQIEKALKAAEVKTLAHQRRLEAIHLQSGTRLEQIEARRQAQLDLVRERAVQREIARQRQLESTMRGSGGALIAILTATAAAGLAAGAAIKKFAEISIQAAIDVNKQVNALKALTGSAEAAEKRFRQLFEIAQKTPGLTTSLATTLDAQLRVFNVAEKTIDKLLPVIGRLNAISPISDPRQFINNFTQLISQNFERQDLKELVGQSPIAGLLIKEIFNVDNPTNAEAIRAAAKRLGVNTVERLAEELIKAGAENSALRNATESFAGQFEKLQDRITVALAPIGEEILRTLLPAFQEFVKLLERDLPKITGLLRDSREELAAVATAFLAVANSVSVLGQALGVLTQQSGIIRNLALLATAIANPGGLSTAIAALDATRRVTTLNPLQRNRLAAAQGELSFIQDTEELRRFAVASGDLRLLASLPPKPADSAGGGGGGIGGGGRGGVRAASAAERERDRELRELTRKIGENLAERREQDIKDFDALNRALQTSIVEEDVRLAAVAGRPAQLARFSAAQAERIAAIEAEDARLVRNTAREAAEELAKLPPILSDSERFMQGFADATLTAGDAFERFGQDVARAFGNVRDLFGSLKRAVLDFFNNLLGSALQNIVRSTLGPLFGGMGGSLGSLFRTPSFAGGFGGGGISAPPSVSGSLSGIAGSVASSIPGFGGIFGSVGGGARASTAGGGGFSFGGLGDSLLSAAPLLGLTIGGALGGSSRAGNILGAAGGLLTSTFISTTLGAPGALGSLAPALFSNPITAIVGAGLLVGSVLLGRAKQRRSDEELSGQYLTQALQGIEQLAGAVASGQITTLGEARGIFDRDILGVFRASVGQLKTKSVRESRLTNQVRDLENVFQARIPPLIAEQERRAADAASAAAIDRRLIPEFATGGRVPGIDRGRDSVLSLLRPGEMVLTRRQQASVIGQSNPGVFDRAGVPRTPVFTGGAQAFEFGGTAQALGQEIVIENLTVSLLVGKGDATRIVVEGGNTAAGRAVIVKNVKVAQTNREL